MSIAKKTVESIEREEDFQELLGIASDFYRLLDLEDKQQAIDTIIKKRGSIGKEHLVLSDDKDIQAFRQFL